MPGSRRAGKHPPQRTHNFSTASLAWRTHRQAKRLATLTPRFTQEYRLSAIHLYTVDATDRAAQKRQRRSTANESAKIASTKQQRSKKAVKKTASASKCRSKTGPASSLSTRTPPVMKPWLVLTANNRLPGVEHDEPQRDVRHEERSDEERVQRRLLHRGIVVVDKNRTGGGGDGGDNS